MNSRVLIADSEKAIRDLLFTRLEEIGFHCYTAIDGDETLKLIKEDNFDLLIVNVNLQKRSGSEILEKISTISPKTLTIVITDHATVETAIDALRKGAVDYFVKPFDIETFLLRIKKIKKFQQIISENHFLRKEIHSKYNDHKIIGDSPAMQSVFKMIKKVANSSSNILITGKSGTGKELVARAIHINSNRAKLPFVPINCGAIPENLFESELFGFKKGSFTGATMDRDGVFKAANNGTLFLDEIGEIPLHTQVKLLRAIETKEIKPIGSSSMVKINTRIVCATNKDLLKEIEEGNFREDLYYRLNIVEINLPCLEERRDDIPILVNHFINKYNQELKRKILGTDHDALRVLVNYKWQGQVRELENIIERAVLLCDSNYITINDLPPHTCSDIMASYTDDLKTSVKNFERQHILSIIKRVEKDKYKCAELLGIGLSSLYRKIDELGIEI